MILERGFKLVVGNAPHPWEYASFFAVEGIWVEILLPLISTLAKSTSSSEHLFMQFFWLDAVLYSRIHVLSHPFPNTLVTIHLSFRTSLKYCMVHATHTLVLFCSMHSSQSVTDIQSRIC